MTSNEVLVFPNHRVEIDSSDENLGSAGSGIWMVRPLRDFLSEVKSAGGIPLLSAATLSFTPGSRNNSQTSDNDRFRFFALGGAVIRHSSFLAKIAGYLVASFQLLFRMPRHTCWYVFFPDPMTALVCLIGCFSRRPYGLYVRGHWKTSGWRGLLNRCYFRKATFIIATGESFKQRLLVYNERVQEVAPMISFQKVDVHAKECYKIQEEAIVLFVGQLHPKKGVLELVKAIAHLGKRHKVRLVIVGDSGGIPGMPGQLETAIRENNCHHLVELVGQIRDKKELARRFEKADLFALPTYYPEGFPRVVYEAMNFGLPVVCTDIEGRKGFLRDGENCRFVEKESSEDLAIKLAELLKSNELRSRIGRNGSRDVRELLARFEGITHGMQVVRSIEESERIPSR